METLAVIFAKPPYGQEECKTFTKRPLGMTFVQRMPLVITYVTHEAAALGVQKGWVITSINGRSLEALDFKAAYQIFTQASMLLKGEVTQASMLLKGEAPTSTSSWRKALPGAFGESPQRKALQRALHERFRQAARVGDAQPPQPHQVRSGAARQLMDLLASLGLERLDVGSANPSEGGTLLSKQCFCLAIARSWHAQADDASGALVRDSALALRRGIEAQVLRARGGSAEKGAGGEREAYADYLGCAMQSEGPDCPGRMMADLAVAVFASCSGRLEAYEGRGYSRLPREERVANLSLIWHRAGHFEAVVAVGSGGKADLTLEELLRHAEQQDIPTAAEKA